MTKQEVESYSSVKDKEVDRVLQEIRKVWPVWLVQEQIIIYKKRIWGPDIEEIFYTVYRLIGMWEARQQMSVHTKRDLLNFLYGLNMGLHKDIYNELT